MTSTRRTAYQVSSIKDSLITSVWTKNEKKNQAAIFSNKKCISRMPFWIVQCIGDVWLQFCSFQKNGFFIKKKMKSKNKATFFKRI